MIENDGINYLSNAYKMFVFPFGSEAARKRDKRRPGYQSVLYMMKLF